jgi:hypothetical protein
MGMSMHAKLQLRGTYLDAAKRVVTFVPIRGFADA